MRIGDTYLKESMNGTTVEVSVENGRCRIRLFGKVSRSVRKAADELQCSPMPPVWVMRQLMKII